MHRPVTGLLICGLWALLTIYWVIMEARDGPRSLIVALPLVAAAGITVGSLFGWPCVRVDDECITLQNVLQNVRMPFSSLAQVTTRFCLTLTAHDGRSYNAWAAPVSGRLRPKAGPRSYFPELDAAQPVPVLGSARSDANAVAVAINRRWQRLDEGGSTAQANGSVAGATTVNWAGGRLIALALCVVLAAALPVLLQ